MHRYWLGSGPVTSPPVRIRPLRGRAFFAILALALAGLHGAATAVLPLTGSGFGFAGWVSGMVLPATAVLFISWLFDARTNLDGVEPPLRWHPIWCYGAWLIPVWGLVIWLQVCNEIDSATQRLAGGPARPGLFAVWATLWTPLLIAWLLGGGVVTAILQVVAAVPAIMLVLRITAQQEAAAALRPLRLGGTAR